MFSSNMLRLNLYLAKKIRSDLRKFSEYLQQVGGMRECCKLPPFDVWSQNSIQMQENSVQVNTFSKSYLVWNLNRNFVYFLKTKILTAGKFWFANVTKIAYWWSGKSHNVNPRIVIRGSLILTLLCDTG